MSSIQATRRAQQENKFRTSGRLAPSLTSKAREAKHFEREGGPSTSKEMEGQALCHE